MKSKNLAMLGFLGAMMMSSTTTSNVRTSNEDIKDRSKKEPKKIIPKGCKEYFFTKSGSIYTTKPQGYEVVFECIASSEKVAKRKFNSFVDTLPVCDCSNRLEFSNCGIKCDRKIF